MFNKLKSSLKDHFNLTQDNFAQMNFKQLSSYSDVIVCNQFQGVDMNYTNEEIDTATEVIKAYLTENFLIDRNVSAKFGTRLLQEPLMYMDKIINGEADPQFFDVSGHDTQVANIWKYLNPNNFK